MHLVLSTENFWLGPTRKSGFPILLSDDMNSCWEANEFLRYYLTRGAIASRKSWAPVGQAMYDFFGFLEAHELAWDDIDRGEDKNLAIAYRDYSLDVVKLRRSTVRQRLSYVHAFYKFALRKGWIAKLPYEYEARRARSTAGFLAHLDASGQSREAPAHMPLPQKNLVKFLTKAQVEQLLNATTNQHHRMITRLALQSGLRRQELATFPASYVFDPDQVGTVGRNIRLVLDPEDGTGIKTKGSKSRAIYISRRLMCELHHYKTHWRGERASLSDSHQRPLFLNQFGLPWAGDGKGIEAMVRDNGAKVGIKTHPHMLRHTYATHTLVALQRYQGDRRIEPLVFLQRQLGHASIETTMVYLHLVNELADEAVLAYDDEINALCEELSSGQEKGICPF